jgi:hypothetical protein
MMAMANAQQDVPSLWYIFQVEASADSTAAFRVLNLARRVRLRIFSTVFFDFA